MKSISAKDWSRANAAHLYGRAGFGARPAELDHLEKQDPVKLVERLVNFDAAESVASGPKWFTEEQSKLRRGTTMTFKEIRAMPEPKRKAFQKEIRQRYRKQTGEVVSWWYGRMVEHQNPLEEKLTLFWHDLYPSSVVKVKAPYPMLAQLHLYRQYGNGNWRTLVKRMAQDPAMLVYLDNARSNKKKPNENFARELFELFTLGEGNYTEEDIMEAARAFTGWSLDRHLWQFQKRARIHDSGSKTVFGLTGKWDGDDVVRLTLDRDRAPEFLAERMWDFFASTPPPKGLIQQLATNFRKSELSIKTLLRDLFLSPAFYSNAVRRKQIKAPVVWMVNMNRSLELPPLPQGVLRGASRTLGQTLLAPPSVKGWDDGVSWITATTLATRFRLTQSILHRACVRPKSIPGIGNWRPDALLPAGLSRTDARDALLDRFFAAPLRAEDRKRLDSALAKLPSPSDWSARDWSTALNELLATPQYQLI